MACRPTLPAGPISWVTRESLNPLRSPRGSLRGRCIKELRVIYSSQILQRCKKEEMYLWHHRFLNDEEKAGYGRMVGAIPSQADRIAAASQGITSLGPGAGYSGAGIPQAFKVPLWTLWFTQSEAQCLMIQGLSNKLSIEIDFEYLSLFTIYDLLITL